MATLSKHGQWEAALRKINALDRFALFAMRGILNLDCILPFKDSPDIIADIGNITAQQSSQLISMAVVATTTAVAPIATVDRVDTENDSQLPTTPDNEVTMTDYSSVADTSSLPTTDPILVNNSSGADEQICPHCDRMISHLLFDNHCRHCARNQISSPTQHNSDNAIATTSAASTAEPISEVSTDNPYIQIEQLYIECRFCEVRTLASELESHELECGSRTDICEKCGIRVTIKDIKTRQHSCIQSYQNNNNHTSVMSSASASVSVSANNGNKVSTLITIETDDTFRDDLPRFEACLWKLQRMLFRKRDYSDVNSHFQTHDFDGTAKPEHIIKRDTQEIYHHNLRQSTNHTKLESIYKLLAKILGNLLKSPNGVKYRILKCDNTKLKENIFAFSPLCDFLKICGFTFIDGSRASDVKSHYILYKACKARLQMALNIVEYFSQQLSDSLESEKKSAELWNTTQVTSKSSIFKGAWSCKYCSHLNRRSQTKCCNCKTKRPIDKSKQKKKENELNFSAETWTCRHCANRNPIELAKCDICKNERQSNATNKHSGSEDGLYHRSPIDISGGDNTDEPHSAFHRNAVESTRLYASMDDNTEPNRINEGWGTDPTSEDNENYYL